MSKMFSALLLSALLFVFAPTASAQAEVSRDVFSRQFGPLDTLFIINPYGENFVMNSGRMVVSEMQRQNENGYLTTYRFQLTNVRGVGQQSQASCMAGDTSMSVLNSRTQNYNEVQAFTFTVKCDNGYRLRVQGTFQASSQPGQTPQVHVSNFAVVIRPAD